MSMQDTISDMLTRIRNAQAAKKKDVSMPSSKIKVNIAKILSEEGYVGDYQVEELDNKAVLKITLKYHNNKPVIDKIKRVSRPGLRVYKSCKDIPQVMGGLGIALVSTSKGIVADRTARTMGHGGEIICIVS
jgi:small subunit ribosomal protein S8